MALSTRFRELRRNLRDLRKELLPTRLSPTGSYSERQLTRTVAYRLLTHAEIEAYLEDRAREVVTAALVAWRAGGEPSRPLLGVLAFCGMQMHAPPDTINAPQPSQKAKWSTRVELGEKVEQAVTQFFRALVQNHGIKEENLLAVLLPLGIKTSCLDPQWVLEMSSFGERRGQAAHSARLRQALDPGDEIRMISSLLPHLERLDVALNDLRDY